MILVALLPRRLACAALLLGVGTPAAAIDWSGTLDLRALAASGRDSWTEAGLGKLRYGSSNDGLRLGQAMLRADADLADTLDATVIVSAEDDRKSVLDVSEGWLRWRPVPSGPWKASLRAGAFFPALSLENEGLGWTPTRTASTSAINSWIGEEFRTLGIEASLMRRGRPLGSLHDIGISAAAFRANDPNGTLLTWRGWSISDRITGLHEALPLADLPVLRAGGRLSYQTRAIHLFREMDGRVGYHVDASYGYGGRFAASVMHYDNRANPRVVSDGQWAWRTTFNHLAMSARLGGWEVLTQAMTGSTVVGRNAAAIDFRAGYVLAAHALGSGAVSFRLDRFSARDVDILPVADPNGEHGAAVAVAYSYPMAASWTLVTEALTVRSTRAARVLIGESARQREHSLTASLRWRFGH